MNTPDLINGLFEAFGGIMIWINVKQILKDKQIKGVSITPTVFFTSWGFWNLFYYPHLHQWLSFTGGLFIVAGNFIWVSLMFYYRSNPKKIEKEHLDNWKKKCEAWRN